MTPIRAILFDLDGTLADTAPDLAEALNQVLVANEYPRIPFELLRPVASAGARGLLGAGLGITPDHADYPRLRDDFLERYAAGLCVHTRLFDGISTLIEQLSKRGLAWGIVTNKATRLAEPLIAELPLPTVPAVVVCGDTTEHAKPHPLPLLYAARQIEIDPKQCLYVGDDHRDIIAGRAAGMGTVAAAYGYCEGGEVAHWQADFRIDAPLELLDLPHFAVRAA